MDPKILEETKIRNLTRTEVEYIALALQQLYLNSPAQSTARWAAEVMLKNDAAFVKKLLYREV